MAKKKKYTLDTTVLGCPHPDEYAFKEQMDTLAQSYQNGLYTFFSLDVGKVLGLAKAYLELKEQANG